MTDTRAASRRQALYVVAVLLLVPGMISVGQAVWHLVVRDELCGLAVAWKGGNGLVLLWLSYWSWRAAGRRRPPAAMDQETD